MKLITFLGNNKFKTIIALFLFSYLLLCQSCASIRLKPKEAKKFFETANVNFIDSTIVIEGSKIHYVETGNKDNPILFFVHGSPGSWGDSYKDYLKDSLLLKKYRMIAIDRPGFGYSNFQKAKNLEQQTNLIEQFVDRIQNGKNIYLIGHSYGGPVIVKMAVDKPNTFKEIVILAGAIDPDAETPEKWRLILKAFPIRYLVPGALRPSNDELWWLKKDLKKLKPNLNKLTTNVLVFHGTKDPMVPYSNVAFIEKEFVNAKSMEVISIKNANHFIPWEHYTEIRDKLLLLKE